MQHRLRRRPSPVLLALAHLARLAGATDTPASPHLQLHLAWANRGVDDVGFDQVANFNGLDQGRLHDVHPQIAKNVSTPAARNPSGGVSVAHRGTNDHVFVMEQNGPGGAFGNWDDHGGHLSAAPVLAWSAATNSLWVVARMNDGSVQATVRDPNGWSAWFLLGLPYTSSSSGRGGPRSE